MIWLGALFFGYALASLAWAPEINALAIANLVGLAGAFWLGLRGLCLWREITIAAIIVSFAYIVWPVLNPNYIGCFLALGIAAGITSKSWWTIAIIPGLVYSESRGAILAAAATSAVALGRRFPVTLFCVCAAAIILVAEQKVLGGSLIERLGIWQVALNNLTLMGHGWGSFQQTFIAVPIKINMTGQIAPHAYNDYLEVLSDLGIGAIPLVALIAMAMIDGIDSRLVLGCFLILGLTYFPLYIPIVAQVFALSLGQLTRSTMKEPLPWLAGD